MRKDDRNPISHHSAAARGKFLVATLLGMFFFMFPVTFHGKLTVPFDVVITLLRQAFPRAVEVYTFLIILAGGVMTLLVHLEKLPRYAEDFRTSKTIFFFRLLGLLLAVLFLLRLMPAAFYSAHIPQLIWKILAVSVALIIPIGAIFVQLFVVYGGMEFLGTLAEPFMRPLFRLPGRAALDALTSWVGSYSVGLYLTRTVMLRGGYTRRQAFTIATCFSTVSIGFVGVVCSTLNILHLFPLVVIFYFLSVVGLTVVLVRIPPISRVPDDYLTTPQMNEREAMSGSIWRRSWNNAVERAALAPPFTRALPGAVGDGLRLAASIIGTILSIGTLSLMLAKFTPVFQYLGLPLVPIIKLLGLPSPEVVTPAVLVEITEMYIPALLVTHAPEVVRFFIAVLSVSQLIFFSSLGPMILDMFRDIPVRFGQLVALFFLRTAILLPFLAVIARALQALGIIAP